MKNIHLNIVPRQTNKRTIKISFKKRGNANLADEYFVVEETYKTTSLTYLLTGSMVAEAVEDVYVGGYEVALSDHRMFLSYSEMFDLFLLLNTIYSKEEEVDTIQEI